MYTRQKNEREVAAAIMTTSRILYQFFVISLFLILYVRLLTSTKIAPRTPDATPMTRAAKRAASKG